MSFYFLLEGLFLTMSITDNWHAPGGYWTHYGQVITSNAITSNGVTSNGITSNGLTKMGILQIFPLVLKAYFHWLDKQSCESGNSSNWTD